MAKLDLGTFSGDGFNLKLTGYGPANPKIIAQGTLPAPIPGFGTKIKAVFKIDPNGAGGDDDTFSSWQLFDGKGKLAISFSNFDQPKVVVDVLASLQAISDAVGTQTDLETLQDFYTFWNSLYDGGFTAKVGSAKKSSIDVGEGGKATITGGKGADTVFVFHDKEINFNGGKGSDTIAFRSQFLESTVVGAFIDLDVKTGQDNPFSIDTGTVTLLNVENVIGTFGDDVLRGTSGNNRLDGGGDGYDELYGRDGNDTLIYASATRTLRMADGGDGTDHLIVDLSFISGSTVHTIDLTDYGNDTGVFQGAKIFDMEVFSVGDFATREVDDPMQRLFFVGNALSPSNDIVTAGNGDDKLDGKGGNDIFTGLGGADELTGGTEADRFVYKAVSDSDFGTPDTIIDFSHDEGDRIDLKAVDANGAKKGNPAFKFIGDDPFHNKAGELHYAIDGNDILVSADVNGDGTADFAIILKDIDALVKGDFVL